MNNWLPLIIVFLAVVIGFIKVLVNLHQINENHSFTVDFINKFRLFCNRLNGERTYDSEAYEWLVLKSSKMQRLMGGMGILSYRPAFANYIHNNYPVILNGIPSIREAHFQLGFGADAHMSMVDDSLLRYAGARETLLEIAQKEARNPLIWLREGVRFIVTSPISLFYWSGLMQYGTYNALSNNFFVKLVSFLIGLVGVVGSIVGITVDYSTFFKLIGID